MKKMVSTFVAFILVAMVSDGHEFWLMTKKFRYKVGEEMNVGFMVGENFQGEPWDLTLNKVERLETHTGTTVKNLITAIKETKGKNLTYKFDREGTHLVALESDYTFNDLEAEQFNTYLEEDGLENILDQRKKSGRLMEAGKEYHKRFAKLIVQCGAKLDGTFRRSTGFRYEIFPVANPAALKPGDYLDCRVMWEGKPAPHRMVKVWSHVGNRIFVQPIYTENDGTIRFPISSAGPWMVSSVKMIPSETEGADYQSYSSSLVFEINQP